MRSIIWTVFIATTLSASPPPTQGSLVVKTLPLAGHVYVIDPGHGGNDAGTKHEWPTGQTGRKRTYLYEQQFTLGVALKLVKQISAQGGTVVMTVLVPDSLRYVPFGQDSIPAQGAAFFNLKNKYPIKAGAEGLSRRLEIGRLVTAKYPDQQIHWISPHFDHVRVAQGKPPVSGTRIIYPPENASSAFVEDLARAFQDAGWLRDEDHHPVVASGHQGVKRLFILRGETDPKMIKVKIPGRRFRRKTVKVDYNHVTDRVLIEYANLESNEDWERLQRPAGSLHRLAEITVKGMIKHAQRDTTTQHSH